MTEWRNRIVGYGEESPEQLLANPRNFRVHPKAQQDALLGVMREVGVVDDVIVNQETGFVVDGHLRVALAISERQPTVPVKYVDLTEAEEALILATFDPIAAMAATDKAQLDALLREVQTGEAAVQAMLAELAKASGVVPSDGEWADALGALPEGDKVPFQQITFTVTDEQARVVETALHCAKQSHEIGDTGNENSNGNAIALVCLKYVGWYPGGCKGLGTPTN